MNILYFQLKGSLDDCSCNVDTVDYFNNVKLFPRLHSLLTKNYFRFYKVNLNKVNKLIIQTLTWIRPTKKPSVIRFIYFGGDKVIPDIQTIVTEQTR